MESVQLTVNHEVGLHARPAAMFVQKASAFQAQIKVRNVSRASGPVDAKSILGVLTLGVEQGDEIEILAEGPDEREALQALSELVRSNFTQA